MLKPVVKHVTYPLIARRDGLRGLCAKLRALEETQFWSIDRLLAHQLEKMRRLLVHAYENVPFYRNRFGEAGFNPYEVKSHDQLAKLPQLTKQDIRENLEDLIAKSCPRTSLHRSETGGTTGVKIAFFRDNACLAAKQAQILRLERWTGWDLGEPTGLVWPATADYVGHHTWKAKLKNAFYQRQLALPAAILDPETMRRFLRDAERQGITLIRAFTSPIYEIAKHALETGRLLRLKGVVTTGEPLFSHQRGVIEEAFACPVFDSYRTREVGPIAQECQEHRGLHLNAELLFVEVDGAATTGEVGDLLITDLENYGMPFIRYRIGDLGRLLGRPCPCGRSLPLLDGIAGRAADTFLAPDGRRIMAGSLVLYLVDEAPGLLGQVQIEQERLNHMIIRMTPDPMPSEAIKAYQLAKVREFFGPEMQVSFEVVEEIPRLPSGKYAFTICRLRQTGASGAESGTRGTDGAGRSNRTCVVRRPAPKPHEVDSNG